MTTTSVGNGWTCQCGAFVPWGVTHGCSGYGAAIRTKPLQEGWSCPKCGGVMAPWMAYCHHCKPLAVSPSPEEPNG